VLVEGIRRWTCARAILFRSIGESIVSEEETLRRSIQTALDNGGPKSDILKLEYTAVKVVSERSR
jgi:hypothetical protein